jgi:hypothetical protein
MSVAPRQQGIAAVDLESAHSAPHGTQGAERQAEKWLSAIVM